MNELKYFGGDELAAQVWRTKYALSTESNPDEMHKRLAKAIAEKSGYDEDFIYENLRYFEFIVPQGSIMATLGTDQIASLSNCFIIGQPDDSYSGIMQKDEELVQLMKRRGGVGIDISTLRPAGSKVTNAARTSSGAASFMHRFSNSTREVAQEGRRIAA